MDALTNAAKQAGGGAAKTKAAAARSPLAAATPPSAPGPAAPSVSPGGASEGGAHLAAIECLLSASPDLALALMLAGSPGGQAGEGAAATGEAKQQPAAAAAAEPAAEGAAAPKAAAPKAGKAAPRTKAALRAAAQQRAEQRGEKRQRLSRVTLSEPEGAAEEEEAEEEEAGGAAEGAAAAAAAAAAAGATAAAAAPEKKPRKKAKKALAPLGPRRYVCSEITMEILEREGCFDMTEWDATRHLGFGSATVLKKLVLPRLGMKVWPYRKRVTMKGIREALESHLEKHGKHADQEKVADLLAQVRAAEQHVRDNPKVSSELSREMTALRQRLYKLKNEEKAGSLTGEKWKHQINMLVANTLRDFAAAAAAGEEGDGQAEDASE